MMQKVLCKEFKYRWPVIGDKIIIKNFYSDGTSGIFAVLSGHDDNSVLLLDVAWYDHFTSSDFKVSIGSWYTPYSNDVYYNWFEESEPAYICSSNYYNGLSTYVKNKLIAYSDIQTAYNRQEVTRSTIPSDAVNVITFGNDQYAAYIPAGTRTISDRKINIVSITDICNAAGRDADNVTKREDIAKILSKNESSVSLMSPIWTLDPVGDNRTWTFCFKYYTNYLNVEEGSNTVSSYASYVYPKIKLDLRWLDWDWYQE